MPYALDNQTPEPQNMASQDRPQHFLSRNEPATAPAAIPANSRKGFARGVNKAARSGARTKRFRNGKRRRGK